jgi:hypothetical protein
LRFGDESGRERLQGFRFWVIEDEDDLGLDSFTEGIDLRELVEAIDGCLERGERRERFWKSFQICLAMDKESIVV